MHMMCVCVCVCVCICVWERMCDWKRERKNCGINNHFVAVFSAALSSSEHLYGTSQCNVPLCAAAHRSSRNLISRSLSSLECMLGWNDELDGTYITTPACPLHTSQLSGALTGSVLSAFHVLLSPIKYSSTALHSCPLFSSLLIFFLGGGGAVFTCLRSARVMRWFSSTLWVERPWSIYGNSEPKALHNSDDFLQL